MDEHEFLLGLAFNNPHIRGIFSQIAFIQAILDITQPSLVNLYNAIRRKQGLSEYEAPVYDYEAELECCEPEDLSVRSNETRPPTSGEPGNTSAERRLKRRRPKKVLAMKAKNLSADSKDTNTPKQRKMKRRPKKQPGLKKKDGEVDSKKTPGAVEPDTTPKKRNQKLRNAKKQSAKKKALQKIKKEKPLLSQTVEMLSQIQLDVVEQPVVPADTDMKELKSEDVPTVDAVKQPESEDMEKSVPE